MVLANNTEIPLLIVYPKEQKRGTQTNVFTNIHGSTIRNRQKVKTAQMSIS